MFHNQIQSALALTADWGLTGRAGQPLMGQWRLCY